MGEIENSSGDLPPSSPTHNTQNSSTSLHCEFDVCDEVLSPRPPSFGSFGPLDCEFLCSPVLDVSLDVHEDQVLDGFGVPQKTCDVIYNDYVWESTTEQESTMKVDFSPSTPLPPYPEIFLNSVTLVEYFKILVSDDTITSDHFLNSWNVNFLSECRDEKYSFKSLQSIISSL